MSQGPLIFGATGFTAGLIMDTLVAQGVRPVLAGRDARRLETIAERRGLEFRTASVDEPESLRRAAHGVPLVLNAAGPFVHTAAPMVEACIAEGAHYLDISGEVDAIQAVAGYHALAREREVMLMPAVGFDVVPSDCLCRHVASRVRNVSSLRVAISGLELLSRGSARTLSAELGRMTRVCRDGVLREVTPGALERSFDFGNGLRCCTLVTWGDLVTAPFTTGVSNIETYFEATPALAAVVQMNRMFGWFYRLPLVQASVTWQVDRWRADPSPEERASRRASIVVEAETMHGDLTASRLVTPEAYSLTANTSAAIVSHVLSGDLEIGFQTPARVYGSDFILSLPGITREDIQSHGGQTG